jgi:hypothetical protein
MPHLTQMKTETATPEDFVKTVVPLHIISKANTTVK